METAAYLNHEEDSAEKNARQLGPAKSIWDQPKKLVSVAEQRATEEAMIIPNKLEQLTTAAAENYIDDVGETAKQREIERIMKNAVDPEDTAALAAIASNFKTDEEIGDDIRAMV